MYLAKHQYKKEKTSETPPLKDREGNAYNKLSVIITSAGAYFDVPSDDLELGVFSNAVELFADRVIENVPNLDQPGVQKYKITSIVFKPTSRDIRKGEATRHFISNTATGKIKEVSEEEYNHNSKNRTLYQKYNRLNWILTGPVKDLKISGHIYKGTENRNKEAVIALDKEMPGIKDVVTDFAQFVIVTPTDAAKETITPQDIAFDIPSPSKKL